VLTTQDLNKLPPRAGERAPVFSRPENRASIYGYVLEGSMGQHAREAVCKIEPTAPLLNGQPVFEASRQHIDLVQPQAQPQTGSLMSNTFKPSRWSQEEHGRFLKGFELHGREWEKARDVVGTRTMTQVRTHTRKFPIKLSKQRDAEGAQRKADADNDIRNSSAILVGMKLAR
jgi:hypothetical protein